ncbi:hypothetical protein H0H92_003820 [Tricholoma furcatifolium]|nr:hypothetical protein H0H92_003820 [Tricholoma furcatifolium]
MARWRDISPEAYTNIFLQALDVDARTKEKGLPYSLQRMIKIARKHDVAFTPILLEDDLKLQMPIWYYVGLPKDSLRHMNKPCYKCYREVHGISTVGDLLRWGTDMRVTETGEHKARRNCKCQPCKDARDRGCRNPHRCGTSAWSLLNTLPNTWNPLSATPERKMDGINRGVLDGGRAFNPSIHTKGSLGKGFRVFSNKQQAALTNPRVVPQWSLSLDAIDVYTDGSCIDNGSTNARAGAGAWFRHEDERNSAIRLPDTLENSNNAGEAVALLLALDATPADRPLRIRTDSLITLESLTGELEKHENNGWIGVANRDILRKVVSRIRSRSDYTILIKVKGHSGDEGNEEADSLANEGATSTPAAQLDLSVDPSFTVNGMSLWHTSQKIVYAGMLERTSTPNRRKAAINLERMREAIAATTGSLPMDARLWRSLQNKILTKETRAFLWRVIQNTYKLGEFWERIENYERRGICPACDTTETMEHILTECQASGQEEIWALVGELCTIRGIRWSKPTFGETLGSQMLSPTFTKGKMTAAGRRMYAITVSESARLIWKIRCEWRISRDSDPTRRLGPEEIRAKWRFTMYRRIRLDCLATKPTKSRSEIPIEARLVQDTWQNILKEDTEPHKAWKFIEDYSSLRAKKVT